MSSFAVVKTGGKQYKVVAGQKIKIERLKNEVGSQIDLDEVLLHSDGDKITIGKPLLSGATVKAKVISHGRQEKIRIFKLKRRKHSKKQQGHRQDFTEIEIENILKE